MNTLVSTNWLYNNLENNSLIIFDSSWHMPNVNRDALKDFKEGHIEKSQFFDIDKISNKITKLPHMVPPEKFFRNAMRSFGVNNDSIIIVYDTLGIYSSARVWWLLKYFGHEKTFVLNGGLKKWLKENKPVTKRINIIKKGNFKIIINHSLKINYKEIEKKFNNKNFIVLDARSVDRFKGIVNEPRPGLRSGHIPKSKNLFWGNLVNKNGTIKSKNILNTIFNKFNLNNKKNIITSCGSGVTACILSLALLHSKNIYSKVYDGSWSEWGGMSKLPIEK